VQYVIISYEVLKAIVSFVSAKENIKFYAQQQSTDKCGSNQTYRQGKIQGGTIGAITHLKPMKVTLFTVILYKSENSIHDIRPF